MKKPKNDLEMEPWWDNPQNTVLLYILMSQTDWGLKGLLPFLSVNAEKLKDMLNLNLETKRL